MKSVKHVLIGSFVVLAATAAMASNLLRTVADVPETSVLDVELAAGGVSLPQYGLYLPAPTEVHDAAPF